MSTVYQSEPGSSGRKEKFLMGLQMIFATITLTELLIIFSLPEYFIVCYSTSTTPTLTMLPLPKPTDFAMDFPTVARSVAFGIVFREFTTTLNPMAIPTGLEPVTSGVTGRRSNQLN